MKDLIAKIGATLRSIRDRLFPRKTEPFPPFEGEETVPESAPAPRAPRPAFRNFGFFLKDLSTRKGFVIVTGAVTFLVIGILVRSLIVSLPVPDAAVVKIQNRDLLLEMRVPEPPMPYDDVELSRDPAAFPGKEEARAYAFLPSESEVAAAVSSAREAVDDFFAGVR